jgi:hypothetical protein
MVNLPNRTILKSKETFWTPFLDLETTAERRMVRILFLPILFLLSLAWRGLHATYKIKSLVLKLRGSGKRAK